MKVLVNLKVAIILQFIDVSNQTNMYVLNLHNIVFQLYLSKAGKITFNNMMK